MAERRVQQKRRSRRLYKQQLHIPTDVVYSVALKTPNPHDVIAICNSHPRIQRIACSQPRFWIDWSKQFSRDGATPTLWRAFGPRYREQFEKPPPIMRSLGLIANGIHFDFTARITTPILLVRDNAEAMQRDFDEYQNTIVPQKVWVAIQKYFVSAPFAVIPSNRPEHPSGRVDDPLYLSFDEVANVPDAFPNLPDTIALPLYDVEFRFSVDHSNLASQEWWFNWYSWFKGSRLFNFRETITLQEIYALRNSPGIVHNGDVDVQMEFSMKSCFITMWTSHSSDSRFLLYPTVDERLIRNRPRFVPLVNELFPQENYAQYDA